MDTVDIRVAAMSAMGMHTKEAVLFLQEQGLQPVHKFVANEKLLGLTLQFIAKENQNKVRAMLKCLPNGSRILAVNKQFLGHKLQFIAKENQQKARAILKCLPNGAQISATLDWDRGPALKRSKQEEQERRARAKREQNPVAPRGVKRKQPPMSWLDDSKWPTISMGG